MIASDIAAGPLAAIRAPGIAGLVADAARPALKPGVVDLITCLRGLWTLPDPAGVLTAMAGLLAPGGHILVQLWDRPARCRLIGTGAALLGKVLPDLTRPAGEAGPFDIDVPFAQARAFVEAAKAARRADDPLAPALEFASYEGEGHGMGGWKPATQADALNRISAFLRIHLI